MFSSGVGKWLPNRDHSLGGVHKQFISAIEEVSQPESGNTFPPKHLTLKAIANKRHTYMIPESKVLGDGCFHTGPTVLSLTGTDQEFALVKNSHLI